MTDLDLALTYIPRPKRQLVADLFALDAALGDVVRTTREPMVGRIRLAWWQERLIEIDQGIVPAEPILEATARLASGTQLTGAMLAELVERWEPLLEDFPWKHQTVEAVAERGALLFGYAATVLGAKRTHIAKPAGSLWSLVDVARHCSDADSRERLVDVARDQLEGFPADSADIAMRPLAMLGLLARRDLERWPDLEPEATPGRAWVMIRHRLTGSL
jgi:15-cis-phytoene synthase